MALEATHIRFALDLQKKYEPTDLRKYVSGAIYPDSRYVTGIDRHLTHLDRLTREKLLSSGDFGKGWHAHLVCDDIQYEVTKELLPEVFKEKSAFGKETWIRHSALKVLQDMGDVRRFDIANYLASLDYIENPNGEDTAVLQTYNKIFQKMYVAPATLTLNEYYDMWREWKIGDDFSGQIRRQAEEYAKDERVMKLVSKIYAEVLGRTL
ncbi:MAG: hypothetical protein Q7R93_01250 [bacterium]|nr:hypothetical protein [bacterium]